MNIRKRAHRRQQFGAEFCPLPLLSFSVSDGPSNSTLMEYSADSMKDKTFIEIHFNMMGDFHADEEIEWSAVDEVNRGISRKLNKLSKSCGYSSFDEFQAGTAAHWLNIPKVTSQYKGLCTEQPSSGTCAIMKSNIEVDHDIFMRSAEVQAIILHSSKLFMDFNIATPFKMKYHGPFSITNKLSIELKGVLPLNMTENEVHLYEETFLELANDSLTQSDPPIFATSAKVIEQLLSPANGTLEIYTEILAYFNTSFDFKTTAINKISAVSQSIPIVDHLKASGSPYFNGLIGVSIDSTNVTNTSYYPSHQDGELVIPSYPSLSQSQGQLSQNWHGGGSVAAILAGLVILIVTVGVVHGLMRRTQETKSVGKDLNTTECVLSPCTTDTAEVDRDFNTADPDLSNITYPVLSPCTTDTAEVVRDLNITDPDLSNITGLDLFSCTTNTAEVDKNLNTTDPDICPCTSDTVEP